MANPNGRKGSKFETDVMKWFREKKILAERLVKAGAKDEGDLVVIIAGIHYVLELKNVKKMDLPKFWEEAQIEAANYAAARKLDAIPPSYVIVKRRYHGIEKAWVIQDLAQWLNERR